MTVVNHTRRYRVDRSEYGKWYRVKSFHFKWHANHYARWYESLGVFSYRVVDTRG